MQSLGSLARNIKPNQNIVEEEHNLKCERWQHLRLLQIQ